jgi:hypothetical protein
MKLIMTDMCTLDITNDPVQPQLPLAIMIFANPMRRIKKTPVRAKDRDLLKTRDDAKTISATPNNGAHAAGNT